MYSSSATFTQKSARQIAPSELKVSCYPKKKRENILGSCSQVTVKWSLRWTGGLVRLYQTTVGKRELSRKAKLFIYQSIYIPTLTYVHEL